MVMEIKKCVGSNVLVRLLRLNDEIELNGGKDVLWLDVDFDHVPHVPVVGEIVEAGRGKVRVGDVVVMDRNAVEIALKMDGLPRIFEDVGGRKTCKVFVGDENIIAVRRGEDVFTMNGYVITEPVEEVLSEMLIGTERVSTKRARVVLAPEGSGLVKGDVVVFGKYADVRMEHEIHKCFFDGITSRMPIDRVLAVERQPLVES